ERVHRALSLLGAAGPGRRYSALLGAFGTYWRAGIGLPVVVLTRLEDDGARPLDRMERRAAAAQRAVGGQQQPVPDPPLGPSGRFGQQDFGTLRAATSPGLGNALWLSTAPVGNPGGCRTISGHLLSRRQLDRVG